MTYGTTVKNPCTRLGRWGYTECTYCKKLYTALGISRHWDKCPKNPKRSTGEAKVTKELP